MTKTALGCSWTYCGTGEFYGVESGLCQHKEEDLIPGSPVLVGKTVDQLGGRKLATHIARERKVLLAVIRLIKKDLREISPECVYIF